jgi:hypothetical protein
MVSMELDDIARRHGFSVEAASEALRAVQAGHGSMAQFDHRELGGPGQWMRGGMTMISDMGNDALGRRVDALFADLSQVASRELRSAEERASSSSQWWPEALGSPASTGAQNDVRYAYFPDRRRLAIDIGGRVTVYDTLDHRIGGFAQQQGASSTLTFASDRGAVDVAKLPIANPDDLD